MRFGAAMVSAVILIQFQMVQTILRRETGLLSKFPDSAPNSPHPHRLLGKHLVHQQRRALRHASGTAAGAATPFLTAERDQVLRMAAITAYPQEAMLQAPALQVRLELLVDVPGQGLTLRRQVRLERRVVSVYGLIKESALRAMVHIRRCGDTRAGFPANR